MTGGRSQAPPSRFCQNIPSATTSNPSMSFTAIIGALTAALPVTMRRTAGARAARSVEVGDLHRQPEPVAPVGAIHDGDGLPSLGR